VSEPESHIYRFVEDVSLEARYSSIDEWLYDKCHQALSQWIVAWRRSRGPDHPRPTITFATHLGVEARTLADRYSKVDLIRIFTEAGRRGECPCGRQALDEAVQT
jgi:hypothetical protein